MTVTVGAMAGFATVQDTGRFGHRAAGVPTCGAMDLASLALANSLAGNDPGEAAIEWALAGGSLRFDQPAVVAVAGAEIVLTRAGRAVPLRALVELAGGDELTLERFVRGAYAYVAVRGGIAVPRVLGSRSTYMPAAFGGLDGRRLRPGDVLPIGAAVEARAPTPPAFSATRCDDDAPVRALEGPNAGHFSPEFRETFWASEFTVSRSSNRAGYRLERDSRDTDAADRSAVSEPACIGAIQVPGGAEAIVLMADGPTIGGYPKIGVVASVDIPCLAQRTPGARVRFQRITLLEAQRLLRLRGTGSIPPSWRAIAD